MPALIQNGDPPYSGFTHVPVREFALDFWNQHYDLSIDIPGEYRIHVFMADMVAVDPEGGQTAMGAESAGYHDLGTMMPGLPQVQVVVHGYDVDGFALPGGEPTIPPGLIGTPPHNDTFYWVKGDLEYKNKDTWEIQHSTEWVKVLHT